MTIPRLVGVKRELPIDPVDSYFVRRSFFGILAMLGRFSNILGMLLLMSSTTACRYDGPDDVRFDEVSYSIDWSKQPEVSTVSETLPAPSPRLVAIEKQPVALAVLVDLALTQNPTIEQARLNIESLSYRITQAGSLPDPNLNTITQLSPVQTAAGEQAFGLSLSQKVIRQNKRETKQLIAESELNAARAGLRKIEQEIIERISNAYYELGFVQSSLDILESDKKKLQLIDSIVDRRFRILKNVSQQETLQVQVALSRLETEIEQYERLKGTLQSKLCRLTHSPPGTKFVAADAAKQMVNELDLDQLITEAIENNPDLHAKLFEIRKTRDATLLADLNHQPDFTVGMNWISTSNDGISPVANGDDAFMLTLGMNLPVHRNRIDAGIREAQVRTLAVTKGYESAKDEKVEDITEQVINLESMRRNLALYQQDIIPKQKLTFDQSIKNYEVGDTDFLQMIDNWRKLLQFEIVEQRMITDINQSFAKLNRLTGSLNSSAAGR